MSEFTKKLKAAQQKWVKARSRAQESTGGIDEIDDGRYLARLMDATVAESKTSGRIQVVWTWKIEDGDFKGAIKRDFDGLETEENLMYLARRLKRFGYEAPDNLEEIEEVLAELKKAKPLCRIRLKTKGDFQNVYLDKVFDAEDESEVLEAASAEETDEEAEESEPESEEPEEEEEEEEEDESVDLSVGMRVGVEGRGEGAVLEILEKEGKVRVRLDDGKVVRVTVDSLSALEADETEEEDDEEEEPRVPAKPAKKPGKR